MPKPWYVSLFERDYYDVFYPGGLSARLTDVQRAQITSAQFALIIDALALPEGARVLDLCCGFGRHAVPLALAGYNVTGLDLSAYHVRLARKAARDAGVSVEFVRGDMREIPRPRRKYDAVINMFTSFGYFEAQDEDQRVLDGVARVLRPGGRFLIDMMNRDGLMRRFTPSEVYQQPDGAMIVECRDYRIETGRVDVNLTYVGPDGERREQSHSSRIYTLPELTAMLQRAGMRVIRTYGDFTGAPLTMDSPRMIVLAERA